MSLLVSFHVDEDGPEYQAGRAPRRRPACRRTSHRPRDGSRTSRCSTSASPAPGGPRGKWGGPPHQFWARARGPLPDDRLLHACVLTYLSDVGTGFEKVELEEPVVGTEPRPRGVVPPPGAPRRLGARRPRARRRRRRARLLHRHGARPRRSALATIAQEHVMRRASSGSRRPLAQVVRASGTRRRRRGSARR